MPLDASRRALSYLQEIRLLTDEEHATAADDPELAAVTLRTPGEALGWVVAREIVSQEQLADLPMRAVAGRDNEAQAIVSEATGLISSGLPLPAWAVLHMSLLERRTQDGVSAEALDQLLALQLIDAAQHAHSLSMLPTHQEAWAAPDSLPATLAWTVRGSGALNENDLKALATRGTHPDIVADAITRVAGAQAGVRHDSSTGTTTRTGSTSTSFSTRSFSITTTASPSSSSSSSSPSSSQPRTQTWTWTAPQGLVSGRWKTICIVVVALIALYLVVGR